MKQFRHILLFTIFGCLLSNGLQAQEFNKTDAQGKKHGLWRGTYEESKRPRYEGTFEHGVETGTFNYFDDTKSNGVIATRTFSRNGTEAYTILYDRSKNIVSEGKMVNKLHEGIWKVYHEGTKQLMSAETYSRGKLNGPKKVYFKDGALAEESNYKEGLIHGSYKKYNEKGVVLEESHHKDGNYEGQAIFRDSQGLLASKGNFKNGAKKGIWEFYVGGKLKKKEMQSVPPKADSKSKEKK